MEGLYAIDEASRCSIRAKDVQTEPKAFVCASHR